VQDVPHGRSFQSVIQFAPAARNEPLAGSNPYNGGTGTGGTSPGNGSNGNSVGFMVAGGSDSENSYLVEGQETADLAVVFRTATSRLTSSRKSRSKPPELKRNMAGPWAAWSTSS